MRSKSALAQVTRTVTIAKGKPSREIMAQTGVDFEMLEKIYGQWYLIKDIMRGFRKLCDVAEGCIYPSGKKALQGTDLDVEQQTLCVLNGSLLQYRVIGGRRRLSAQLVLPECNTGKEEFQYGQFAFFVTKELKWIVYLSFPSKSFQLFDDPEVAVKAALETVPAETYFGGSDTLEAFASLALEVTDGLRKIVRDSIAKNKRDLDKLEPADVMMKKDIDTYAIK